MKKLLGWVAILALIVTLVPGNASAQSEQQGIAILKEAQELKKKARSRENLKKAIEKYEDALRILEKAGLDKRGEFALSQMGGIYAELGNYHKAVECYEKSLRTARKLGFAVGEAGALMRMGKLYKDWGQYLKALEYSEKALEVCKKMGNAEGESLSLILIGETYCNWGQYVKALEYAEKALEADMNQRNALNLMGLAYNNMGQYVKALECFENNLEAAKGQEDLTYAATALHNMGIVYKNLGQFAKALQCYEKSLEIVNTRGELKSAAIALHNMGNAYAQLEQHYAALQHYQNALAIEEKFGLATKGTATSIADLYLDMGKTKLAEPWVERAGDSFSRGRLNLVKGDATRAIEHYRKALDWSEQRRDLHGIFTAYTGLGQAHEALKDYKKAEHLYQKSIEITEDQRSGLQHSERTTFFNVRMRGFYRTEPFEGMARVLLKLNRPAEAFKQSEYTKARLFTEAMSKKAEASSFQVPGDIFEKDSSLNSQLVALTRSLQNGYEKQIKDIIATLEPQVQILRKTLAAHVELLHKQFPLFAATKYPYPMNMEHTALKDDEWVLEYEVTEPGTCIYLVHGKKIVKALFKPIERKEINSLVRKFREPLEVVPGKDSISQKLKAFDFAAGKKLSDFLLADVLPDLPKSAAVIIVPDESLSVVPFEMLVLNSGGEVKTIGKIPTMSGAEFFGDRNPISYYQSVTALTLARTLQKKSNGSDRLLVMADPVFQLKDQRAQGAKATKIAEADKKFYSDLMATMEDPNGGGLRFGRLPLTGELATNLKEVFKGQSDCYTGVDATKETLLKTLAPKMDKYGTLVFATHGYFNKNNPGFLEPILALTMVPPGTDGFLRMSEVMGLKLNADIVALTACQTGLGRNISGEGTMGMGRAFQYAGAKSVLMSLWNVEQKASVQLVESFFNHRKEGKTKLEALRMARQEIREAGYDHPFFWAPFILVGEVD